MVGSRTGADAGRASRRRRLRIGSGVASLGVAFAAGIALIPSTPGFADSQTQAVAVDIQAYVPDAGPDAYQADACSQGNCQSPDPISVHIGATPDQQGPLAGAGQSQPGSTYHSLFHIELSALPQGASVSSLVLKLTITNPSITPADNYADQNQSPAAAGAAAALDAYPLSTPLQPSFSGCSASASCNAPAPDTNGPHVVGLPVKDASGNVTGFTFDVGPMLTYWQAKNQNTGLAIVPDLAATAAENQVWAISFERSLATVEATFASSSAASAPLSGGGAPAPFVPSSSSSGSSLSGISGAPLTPSTPASTPAPRATPRPTPAPAAVGAVPASGGGAGAGMIPVWLLVLGVSLAASVALLAQPVAAALTGSGGLRMGLLNEFKLHPRVVGVAGALLIWSSAWGAYASTHAPVISGGGAPLATVGGGGSSSSNIPGYSPGTVATPGATGSGAAGGSSGGGGGGTVNGAPVGAAAFAGANTPTAPQAHLFSGPDETVGVTNNAIYMCAHAALTFGPAFNIGASDLNVFWDMVDDPAQDPYPHTTGQAGIYNRLVLNPTTSPESPGINVVDDGYQPSKAVGAAQSCQTQPHGDFFLLSGIGFDQIPAVRVWAEQNHVLYIHHIATQQGTAGMQYSFTMLPTLETVGTQFGQYYLTHMSGEKIGIIERNSSNWAPGVATFKQTLAAAGQSNNIGPDDPVSNNQSQYQKEIADMCNPTKKMDAVLIWENALAADEIIQQANQQGCNPKWLLFPFNLTLYTLNSGGADTSQMQGMVPWPAYTCPSQRPANYFAGAPAPFREEVSLFEKMYAKYDGGQTGRNDGSANSGANLCGYGGDLLFGTFEAWRQVAQLLVDCGVNCTRDGIAGLMLNGYRSQVGANCPVDFSGGDHHHGGADEDLYATEAGPSQRIWYDPGRFCQASIS